VEPLIEALQRLVSPDLRVHSIPCDREAGTANVFLLKVWQHLLEFSLPLAVLPRYPSPRIPGLPYAEKPNPVEAFFRKPIQLAVGNVVQCCRSAKGVGQIS
jgi:hypothetical protein